MMVARITSYRPAFSWLPTRMDNGRWIWLKQYQRIDGGKRKRLFIERNPPDRGENEGRT